MKNLSLIITLFFFLGCKSEKKNITTTPLPEQEKITVIFWGEALSIAQRSTIKNEIIAYDKRYPLTRDTFYIIFRPQHSIINGKEEVARTFQDTIFLKQNQSISQLKNTIKHELFHSLAPFFHPISNFALDDGAKVTHFFGLNIMVTLKNKQLSFTAIEEASAEACAVEHSRKLNERYSVGSIFYGQAGSLMLKIISKKWLSADELVSCAKKSDLLTVIAKILNKPREKITSKDFNFVAKQFDIVFHYECNVDSLLSILEKNRNVKGAICSLF